MIISRDCFHSENEYVDFKKRISYVMKNYYIEKIKRVFYADIIQEIYLAVLEKIPYKEMLRDIKRKYITFVSLDEEKPSFLTQNECHQIVHLPKREYVKGEGNLKLQVWVPEFVSRIITSELLNEMIEKTLTIDKYYIELAKKRKPFSALFPENSPLCKSTPKTVVIKNQNIKTLNTLSQAYNLPLKRVLMTFVLSLLVCPTGTGKQSAG